MVTGLWGYRIARLRGCIFHTADDVGGTNGYRIARLRGCRVTGLGFKDFGVTGLHIFKVSCLGIPNIPARPLYNPETL
jgi:hypothetical protein